MLYLILSVLGDLLVRDFATRVISGRRSLRRRRRGQRPRRSLWKRLRNGEDEDIGWFINGDRFR